MPEINPPFPMSGDTAETFREFLYSSAKGTPGIVTLGNPPSATTGDLAVTANGTNMTLTIKSGSVVVAGTVTADQAYYHCASDSNVNVTLDTANGTNPRIDLIVARVYDSDYGETPPGGLPWHIEKVTGTPASVPVAPAVPANSYVLAQIAVAAGTGHISQGNVTDKRTQTGLTFTSVKMLGVATPALNGTPGPVASTPFLYQAGSVVVTPDGTGHATITFPTAFPLGVLTILVSNGDGAAQANALVSTDPNAVNTKTQFSVRVLASYVAGSPITGATRVNYLAIGF